MIERLNINFQSILKISKNIVISIIWWCLGLLWPSRSNIQLEFLRYFNLKCENELLLVVKPPCGVPDGLVILRVRYWYTHHVNNELSNRSYQALGKFYNFTQYKMCAMPLLPGQLSWNFYNYSSWVSALSMKILQKFRQVFVWKNPNSGLLRFCYGQLYDILSTFLKHCAIQFLLVQIF